MTAQKAIENIYNSEEFNSFLYKLTLGDDTDNLREDLKQEVILILLEYDKESIIELSKNNRLKYFVTRIAINQYNSKTSKFYNQYKKFPRLTTNELTIKEPSENKDPIEVFEFLRREVTKKKGYTRKQWFDKLLLEAYVEAGTMVELSKRTGINRKTISKHLKRIKEQIKKKWKQELL